MRRFRREGRTLYPLIVGILIFGFATLPAWGKAKTAAVPFLTLDVSARSSGMGGAQAALVNDVSALVVNPAGLRHLVRPSVALFHASYIDSSFYDFAGFGRRFGKAGAFGVGAQFLSQGSSEQTDVNGNTTGSLTPSDMALSVGYAQEFSGFILGAAGKYIQSKLVDTASDVALDAGVLSPPLLDNQVRLAASVSNVGPPIKYQSVSQDLPTQACVGASFSPTPQWTLAGDAVFPNAGDTYGALGVEYHVPIDGPFAVALRGGYNTQTKDLESTSGYSGGIGFNAPNFGLDYALVTLGELGLSHRFSLNFRFGQETKPPIPKKFPLHLPD